MLSASPPRRSRCLSSARSRTTRSQPKSVEFQKQGEAALAAGKLIEADDAFETALAVDPRNRAAFVAMAKVAMKQKLYGQAIRLTNKALTLEPTDKDALAVQGEAMVEQGAAARAKDDARQAAEAMHARLPASRRAERGDRARADFGAGQAGGDSA